MRPFVESELIRTPLEEICLQCKRVRDAGYVYHFGGIAISYTFDSYYFYREVEASSWGP